MTSLTIVMIVKNEEDKLAKCLDAAQTVADEIVIVDTGSNDQTVDIAKRYTANVLEMQWQDDFSAARNKSLDHASGDWCLVVDADEVIQNPSKARTQILEFIRERSSHAIGTVEIQSQSGPDEDGLVAIQHTNRLFTRNCFRYQGAIHEQLVAIGDHKVFSEHTGVVYQHTGYRHDAGDSDHKAYRNIPLLEKELITNPNDEYYLYQLGQAHFTIKSFKAAISAFEQALTAINFESSIPTGSKGPVSRQVLTGLISSLCYSYINSNEIAKAKDLMLQHLALGHDGVRRADFAYALGYLHFVDNNALDSIAAYQLSIQFGPEHEDVRGTGSYLSHYHLGLLFEACEDPLKALEHYATAIQINPAYQKTIERCIDFVVNYQTLLPQELIELSCFSQWKSAINNKLDECLAHSDKAGEQLLLKMLEMCKRNINPDTG